MRVLVVNCGSSTIKYQVIDTVSPWQSPAKRIDRVGQDGSATPDHRVGIAAILDEIELGSIDAVGHRVVHGGDRFMGPTRIDAAVETAIEELSVLAPDHNPAALAGIRAVREISPEMVQVAVFDTAFHATLPPAAYTYAIDPAMARKIGVRRYGFHGTSFAYVARESAKFLSRPAEDLRMLILHLGSGASAAAIDGGISVDTSMGLTPLEGLVMGTRVGDLDPGAVLHLQRAGGMDEPALDDLFNRRSGLLGLSGHSDMRDLIAAMDGGDSASNLAFQVYIHRLRHYIGAYLAQLGGIDALVFTAGVGEHSPRVREAATATLAFAGVQLDTTRNSAERIDARMISADGSPVSVLVVPTDEQWEIARETASVIDRG